MSKTILTPALLACQSRADGVLKELQRRVALTRSMGDDLQRAKAEETACVEAVQKAELAVALSTEPAATHLVRAAKAANEDLEKARNARVRLDYAVNALPAEIAKAEEDLLEATEALTPLYREAQQLALAEFARELTEAATAFAATMRRGYALSAAFGHAIRSPLGDVLIPGIQPHTGGMLIDHDRLRDAAGGAVDLSEAWRQDGSAKPLHDRYSPLHATVARLSTETRRIRDRQHAEGLAADRARRDLRNPYRQHGGKSQDPAPPEPAKFIPQSWTVTKPGTP